MHERNDDSLDERPVEEERRRKEEGHRREHPSDCPGAQSSSPARAASPQQNPAALNGEEQRRSSPSAGRWPRDHQIVHEATEDESASQASRHAEAACEWTKQKPVRQVPERGVPASAPELAEALRPDRNVHERPRLDSGTAPAARQN